MERSVGQLIEMLEKSRVTAFLGGAGVSTESGIPDFRSAGSAEAARKRFGYPPETLLSHDFFLQETETFYAYYKSILLLEAQPNPAHYALARLEAGGKLNAVVTQNIDNLHQMAGSKRVYPLHGNVEWNRCMACNKLFDRARKGESQIGGKSLNIGTVGLDREVVDCKECVAKVGRSLNHVTGREG